jgi:undecaprenyl diphosphate synthase
MTTKLDHVAFIMDGNSTWAKINVKSQMDGYRAGMRNISNVLKASCLYHMKYTTFYAFSSENWGRPRSWVSDFMNLVLKFLKYDETMQEVLSMKPKIKIIGNTEKLSQEIQEILSNYETSTSNNEGIVVNLAISYGGRDEIVRAVKRIGTAGLEISEEAISNNLDTRDVPDPQLIVRTSGKQRLSNFLLWQASYSELYFTDTLWPDFGQADLERAIEQFEMTDRKHGQ